MAKAFSVEVSGVNEVRQMMARRSLKATQLMNVGLAKASLFLLDEVKQSILGNRQELKSVDTSRFLQSVSIMKNGEDAKIFTNLSYAKGLEFGTSSLPPRRHFANTASRSKGKAISIMKKEMEKL